MVSKMLAFINLLRTAGLPVSQSEVLDMFRALSLLEPSRKNIYTVLQTTLVKNKSALPALNKLFAYFFTPSGFLPQPEKLDVNRILADPPRLPKGEFTARLAEMKDWLQKEIEKKGALAKSTNSGAGPAGTGRPVQSPKAGLIDILRYGAPAEMQAMIRNALAGFKEKPGKENFGTEELEDIIRQLKAQFDFAETISRLKQLSSAGTSEAEILKIMENIEELEYQIRQEVEREWWRRQPEKVKENLEEIARRANLAERDFSLLDPRQAAEIKQKLVRLGRRLATHPGYRRIPAPGGEVDMRRTMRRAMSAGGVPALLCYRKRQLTRPEVLILCDLSGSVAPYCKFMLTLVYAMQEKFKLVRSFAFVDAVAEVTGLLKNRDPDLAVQDIYRQTRIWQTGFSDYGAVWDKFYRTYHQEVTPKTTLLILGDARNNYKPDGAEYFARLCRQAGRVIWLNPAPRAGWDREDSILRTYAPYCHKIFECRNLRQLETAIRRLWNCQAS